MDLSSCGLSVTAADDPYSPPRQPPPAVLNSVRILVVLSHSAFLVSHLSYCPSLLWGLNYFPLYLHFPTRFPALLQVNSVAGNFPFSLQFPQCTTSIRSSPPCIVPDCPWRRRGNLGDVTAASSRSIAPYVIAVIPDSSCDVTTT